MIILDESHYIKTIDSQRSKAVTEIAKRACRVLCLSGTPILSKPIELWTQLNILNPGAFMTYHLFGLRYCNASRSRFYPFWDYSGSSNLRELNWILNRYFLIRRSKSSVLSQLPKKTRQQINIDTKLNKDMINLRRSATFLKEYILRRVGIESSEDAGEIKDKTEIDEDTSTIDQSKLTIVNRLYHASGLCKIPGVQDFIADLIDSGDKFLLFGHHVDFLDSMEEFLKSRKVSYIRIDGQSSVTARQASVEEFQSNESCQVALLSVTAAGVGITLTAANKVVFGELYWTPATLIQAEDRVHRIGQSNAVNVYYILGNGTIDDDIWPVIRKKFAVVSNVLDGRVISTFPGKSKKQNPLI